MYASELLEPYEKVVQQILVTLTIQYAVEGAASKDRGFFFVLFFLERRKIYLNRIRLCRISFLKGSLIYSVPIIIESGARLLRPLFPVGAPSIHMALSRLVHWKNSPIGLVSMYIARVRTGVYSMIRIVYVAARESVVNIRLQCT